MSDASGIKVVKKIGPCYRCGGCHLQCKCKSNGNNKFQNKPATQQTQKCGHTDHFHNNKTSKHMFPTGTLSFQASQAIGPGKDVLVSIDTIK